MLAVLHPFHRNVPSLRALADPSARFVQPAPPAIVTRVGGLDASAELGQRLNCRGCAMAAGLEFDGEPVGRRPARGTDRLWRAAR